MSGHDLMESGRALSSSSDQSAPFRGSERPDIINPLSGRGPHRGYKFPCSPHSHSTPLNLTFGWLWVPFLWVFGFLHFSHIPGIVFQPLSLQIFLELLECYLFLEYEMHISAMLKFLGLSCDIILYLFFHKSFSLLLFCQIFVILTRIFLKYFSLENSCWICCRIMSAGSPPRRVRQRLVEDRAAIQAKIMDRSVIAERNVLRVDIMVPPLDNILDIIQTYNWWYLHNCACVVYTRLVKLFCANLEVVQKDDHGVVLQSSVASHLITVDPQVISHIIRVPVLEILASPYNEVVLPPSQDDLREFFRAVPQGEERSTAIRIGALSSTHRMLAKIIQQNIWPVARRSDLILKQAQFVYAIHLLLPFCLCKHILGVI
jgi:hypothetical protein